MENDFVKKLDFDSDTFEDMKRDMNFVLQRLIGNMQEKGTLEGSMTLKIDVTMTKEYIPNYDPDIEGETREVSKPQFKHKVTSAVKINDEKSGSLNSEMELYLDEDTGTYKLRPIANTTQRTIFDADFMQQEGDEHCVNDPEDGWQGIIEGDYRPLLPGPEDESGSENPENKEGEETTKPAEILEDEGEPGAGLDDITEELLGDEPDKENNEDDGYGYEEPEDGSEE